MQWYAILARSNLGPRYWGVHKYTKARDAAHARKKLERVERGYRTQHPRSGMEFTIERQDPKSWSTGKGLGHSLHLNPYSKKARYRHSRLKSRSRFDKRSFRTIKIGGRGKLLRVGCPKGKWRRGRCNVGIKSEGVLTPKKYAKLLRLTRSRSSRHMVANGRSPKARRKSWA